MPVTRKRASAKNIFSDDVKTQIKTALDSLIGVHGDEITAALEESGTHRIGVALKLDIDTSESEPSINLDLQFVPRTVKDRRSIRCTNPDQREFTIFTPSEIEAREEDERKARKEAEEAEKARVAAQEAANGGEPEQPEDKPKKRKKKEEAD